MDNLTVLAIIIIVFWLTAVAYYVYVSRQQTKLGGELQELKDILENDQDPNN